MENARQWLEKNGSFREGVQLLELIGGKAKDFLPYLNNHCIAPKTKAALRAAIESHLPSLTTHAIPLPSEPDVITQYRQMGRRSLKIQADLHTKMKVAATDTERYEIARQLMEEVIPEIDRIYDAIRAYENDNIIPASPEVDAVRIAAKKLVKEKYLHDRIIRLNRFLESGQRNNKPLTDTERSEYEKEVLEKTAELEALRIELGINKE